jgi:uncharacterized membrane protein
MPEISVYCPGCGRSVQADDLGPEVVEPSTTSRRDALLSALAYVGIVPAAIMLVIPSLRQNHFVRFHCFQSLLFAGVSIVIAVLLRIIFTILSFVPFIGFLLAVLAVGITFLAIVFLWIVLIVKAAQGQAHELPWIGRFAAKWAY